MECPVSRNGHGCENEQMSAGPTPSSRDGIALLSVLLIVALLGLTAVPMLEVTRRTQERAIKQQLLALLNKVAKENLEIGI